MGRTKEKKNLSTGVISAVFVAATAICVFVTFWNWEDRAATDSGARAQGGVEKTRKPFAEEKEEGARRQLDVQSLLSDDGQNTAESFKLTREDWEKFLHHRGRSAEALAVAATVLWDEELFGELARKYPEDPTALMALIEFDGSDGLQSQVDRIETLRRVDPNNAAGSIYAAIVSLQSGDEALAFLDLIDLEGHGYIDFGFEERATLLVEAYQFTGWDRDSATVLGYSATPFAQLNSIHQLSKEVADSIDVAHGDGQHAYARSLADAGLAAASLLEKSDSKPLIVELIFGNMERTIYEKMNQFDLIREGERLVFERIEELNRTRDFAKSLPDFQNLEDRDIFQYFEIARSRGEREAIEWAMRRN